MRLSGGICDATPISKIMALTSQEFANGMDLLGQRLRAQPSRGPDGAWRFAVGAGACEIRYGAQAGVRLGGLLELPRALVTLRLEGLDAAAAEACLRAFDITFQRGGG